MSFILQSWLGRCSCSGDQGFRFGWEQGVVGSESFLLLLFLARWVASIANDLGDLGGGGVSFSGRSMVGWKEMSRW